MRLRCFKNGKINLMMGRTLIGAIHIEDMDKVSPFIKHLDIKPKYQNKGYGTLLLQRTIDEMVNKEGISLHVDIDNKDAIRLYRRFGFFIAYQVVKKVKNRKFYCMTKKL